MNKFRQILLVGIGALSFLSVPILSLAGKASAVRHPRTAQSPVTATSSAPDGNMQKPRPAAHPSSPISLSTYTVRQSDTLWQIAQVSGITVSKLQQINGIRSNTIIAGQRLRVPQRWQDYARTSQARSQLSSRGTAVGETWLASVHSTVSMPGVPLNLIPIYKAAGSRYGIPWTVLAAIHKTETDCAVSHCPVSSEGAMGPMQFLPTTFAAYGVAAPGKQGRPDIQDVRDAVYTAAHMLARDGFSRNPTAAIYAYNHSTVYVKQIMTLAHLHL